VTHDFLIAGGGIGGAVLGELLARGGKKAVVMERSLAPPAWVRPEILWPATVDRVRSLLPDGAFEAEAGVPLRGLALEQDGRELLSVPGQAFDEAGVQPWSTDPNRTRELLLRSPAFELHRGLEVVRVLVEGGRVAGVAARDIATGAEREMTAAWTVGDDGAHSRVRDACGIDIRLRRFPLDFLCFGFDWPASLPPAAGRVWVAPRGSARAIAGLLALPLPRGKGTGVVLARPEALDAGKGLEDAWGRFVAQDGRIADVVAERQFPAGFQRVKREWGHARRYGGGGAVILGDAAHPVSPAGGQGANMSVADAVAIAEIALRGDPDLPRAYEARRRRANERSLRFTRIAARAFTLPRWVGLGVVLPPLIRWLGGRKALRTSFLRTVSATFQDAASLPVRRAPGEVTGPTEDATSRLFSLLL
jgi:2-polyprenyl-6-methoxyphenol hydroxylase-like FAD-dependent oxidoreductase